MINTLQFYMKVIEPHIIVNGRTSPRSTYTYDYGIFEPIHRVQLHWENYMLKRSLIKQGFKPKQCQGCGEGWVEFTIVDPNWDETKRIHVCKDCVDFYGWKCWTKRKYPYRSAQ